MLAQAMIKQIDRVINDLRDLAVEFRSGDPRCCGRRQSCRKYRRYEGDRPFPTTGKQGLLHP
ncbi:MAG TPA: hypothetical protein VGS58_00920 [Candidatus Sulfopaludibacter sp.]|nr:hypothetical protein [Candidatus Sulfopaludibacter sp.]